MTPGRRGHRAGAAATALGTAAVLAAALAGCARQGPPLSALEPGEAPMVTGQSPGSPFAEGSKEAPFSSANSYPQGAASPPLRAR